MSGSAIITTVAGSGAGCYRGDEGLARSATLQGPSSVAVDASGNLYIADRTYIRMVSKSSGIISLVATGMFINLHGIALDASGNLYLTDADHNRVHMVSKSSGIITTVAGTGVGAYSGDGGPATNATLNNPRSVTVDASGNLYIADAGNNRIRMVTKSSGTITTVAGSGTFGYSWDGIRATSAALYHPSGVAICASGNLYIADAWNNRIRMVSKSSGIITTVAGNGVGAYSGDGGPATNATLNNPRSVTVDASGNLYIADAGNNRIRMVTKSSGTITTVAGTGVGAYSGDGGPAASATLNNPSGVTLDASGNLYIADLGNYRVRATGHYCYHQVLETNRTTLSAIVGAIVCITFLILLIVVIQARRLKNKPVKPFGIYVALRSSPPSDTYSRENQ
jgi:trimeric autotransporter adhesin